MGVNPNYIDIVCGIENNDIPLEWQKLMNHYNYVRFFFYNDTRVTKNYISSIRPNILKQHFKQYPTLKAETIFYHDCDIIFTKPISDWITDDMINDDKWYGSDTRWYVGHSYIKSKGEGVLDKMCDIVNISKKMIEENENNTIGAQYLMKDIDYTFWDTVERDSENLFRDITELNNQKKQIDPSYHELQIWCADMWAVLWNAWKMGYETTSDKRLDFGWVTNPITDVEKYTILHNAGVVADPDNIHSYTNGLFYKGNFINELPYNKELTINENYASSFYWKEICETAKKSCLIEH